MATIYTESLDKMRTETMRSIGQRHEEFNHEIDRIQKGIEEKRTNNSEKLLDEIAKMLENL